MIKKMISIMCVVLTIIGVTSTSFAAKTPYISTSLTAQTYRMKSTIDVHDNDTTPDLVKMTITVYFEDGTKEIKTTSTNISDHLEYNRLVKDWAIIQVEYYAEVDGVILTDYKEIARI
ncbi:hypothetical protein HZI73_08705 [Vallitalea pronyensis]|uniref:Uncharacterized protein n=1 Tax=Vallitalea pronyensis TaxID=1348613 RepID=A0A8J8SGA2_9FIRM|nr:hypothetical protein [Vallitalea pronyensis]QUI22376.1 hypothetical protein HZI73_08705 [Vallitalea pronyensis]